jgi:hypothetical protein
MTKSEGFPLTGREVVRGERDVDSVSRVRRSVQCDDVDARGAGLANGGVGPWAAGQDEDALVAAGDGVLDLLDLRRLVAVLLASHNGEVDPVLLGLRLGALLHGDEERVDQVLEDERYTHLLLSAGSGGR